MIMRGNKIFTLLLLFAIFGTVFFAVFAFSTVNHNVEHGCPISSLPVADCSSVQGGISLALHHISGILNLTQTTLSASVSLLLFLVLLLFARIVFVGKIPMKKVFYPAERALLADGFYVWRARFLYWLSFHYRHYHTASLNRCVVLVR